METPPGPKLSAATFATLRGTRFRVLLPGAPPAQLELVKLTHGGIFTTSGPAPAQYENFSLLFHGPKNPALGQATYPFEHSQLGRFDLFITPIAADPNAIHYEAVFNTLTDAESASA